MCGGQRCVRVARESVSHVRFVNVLKIVPKLPLGFYSYYLYLNVALVCGQWILSLVYPNVALIAIITLFSHV